jgi:hypothetical protein
MSAISTWGSTAAERRLPFACDRLLPDPDDVCYRAIDVAAPPGVVFRWLCQLKLAPYSYDWIDNLGRTSPRQLVPGVDDLAVGQRAITFFEVADFDPERQLTLALRRPRWARERVVVTYAVRRRRDGARIVVKLLIRYPAAVAALRRRLPILGTIALLGDLVMMRKQLSNLRDLAEQQARQNAPQRRTSAHVGARHQEVSHP